MYYTFPCIRGIQAGREYYVSMCPLRLVSRLFLFNEPEVDPLLRSQRVINRTRIPAIASYIVNHPDSYVFSSLTVSIDQIPQFTPASPGLDCYNLGTLKIPMAARFIVNDGQHRRAGVEAALKMKPDIGNETISIVFFVDEGLKRSQQMFSDLNRYNIRPTESLNILYDTRDPIAEISRRLIECIPVFKGFTEIEKSTISNRSSKVFTLSGIYRGTFELLEGCTHDDKLKLATEFWVCVSGYLQEWHAVINGDMTAGSLRRDYIHAHAIFLLAIGKIGRILTNSNKNWKDALSKLGEINWHRTNPLWEGRIIIGGKISFSRNNLNELVDELMGQIICSQK